jgi:gas vesicle protein
MEREENARIVTFLAGVALGAALGAGIALLVAPQSGKKTRRRIRRVAGNLKESAGDRWDEVAEDVRSRVEEVLDVAKKKFA